uniref:Uncharacterized protein n=1 Tax=Salix viminalis TaxID=40686 RepID=A0A6N2LKA7_SALVM
MSPMYKPFSTPGFQYCPSLSLPLFSFFFHKSLSLFSASVHSISKKILDHLSDTPSKQLIVSPGLEVSPRHQHVNEGGSIALETPGAHRIGDWRLGY